MSRRLRQLVIWALLACLSAGNSALAEEKQYLSYETYTQLIALCNEIDRPHLSGLSQAGLALWSKGQLQMPESGHLIQGDFNRDGIDDAAMFLEGTSCHYLLVAEHAKNQNWKRAALLKVQGDNFAWNGKALVVKERGQNSQFVAFVNGRYRIWQGPLAVYCFEYDDNAFAGTMLKMTYLGPQSEPYPDLLIGSFYRLTNPARFGDRLDENNVPSKDVWCLTIKPETISKFIHALIESGFDQRAQDRSSKSGTMKHLLSIVDITSAKRPNKYKLLLYGNESSSLLAAFSKALKQDNSQGALLLDEYALMFKD